MWLVNSGSFGLDREERRLVSDAGSNENVYTMHGSSIDCHRSKQKHRPSTMGYSEEFLQLLHRRNAENNASYLLSRV